MNRLKDIYMVTIKPSGAYNYGVIKMKPYGKPISVYEERELRLYGRCIKGAGENPKYIFSPHIELNSFDHMSNIQKAVKERFLIDQKREKINKFIDEL